MGDTAPPPSDRRIGERYLACFPASLERSDGEQRPSIIRDLSESGALLLVRTTKVAVGDEVRLQLYIADDASTFRPATALTMYADEIRLFRERAERLGLK